MAKKLINFNGRFCESDFENAFLSFLEDAGWSYLAGDSIKRSSPADVLCLDDLKDFLTRQNPDLTEEEIIRLCDTVRLAGAESDFAVLHKVYGWTVDGIAFTPQSGQAKTVQLIDFDRPAENIFRAVNQFSVDYVNSGQTKTAPSRYRPVCQRTAAVRYGIKKSCR